MVVRYRFVDEKHHILVSFKTLFDNHLLDLSTLIMALTLSEFSAQSSQTRICVMVYGSVLPEADFGNTTSGSTNETVPRSDGELAEEQACDLTDKFGQAIARTATFHSKLTIMDEPTAALGVQETTQVENIIRTLKEQGEPLILISHNMRQVMDLCDRIVVWRRGRVVANLRKEETDGQDVVAYITGAKTQPEYADVA